MRCFFNDKPWITSNDKDILNRKRRTFKDGDWEELKCVQGGGEVKAQPREAKEEYRRKVRSFGAAS